MSQVAAPEPEWFSTWFDSPYYHLLYRNRSYTEAGAFIDALLEHLHPKPNAHLLDLACGKGRYALHLSERGYEVTGLDLLATSIAAAQRQEHARLHFLVHDTPDPLPYGPFDLMLNLFTSFGYFQDQSENVVALRNATAALQSGGKMAIDFLNTEQAIRELVAHEHKTVEGVTFHVHRHLDRDLIVKEISFQTPGGQNYHHAERERVRVLSFKRFRGVLLLGRTTGSRGAGRLSLQPLRRGNQSAHDFHLEEVASS